ncbi:MAG: hypothetical protein WEB90_05285 [Gemmatimonadota bacterium]
MTPRVILLAGAIAAQGCFVGSTSFDPPAPTRVAVYEARMAADPSDVTAAVSLAVLQLREGRAEDARELLVRADAAVPGDPALMLLRAIAEERVGDYATAGASYAAYRRSHIGVLARHAGIRMAAMGATTLRLDTRRALSEPLIDPEDLDERLIAVVPFSHSGSDVDAEALSAAVADVVTRDVGATGRWSTVDGARVRVLLDEMDVPIARRADLDVALEVGQRLGAARVVQGVSRRVSLDVVVWDITVLSLREGRVLQVDQVALEGGVTQVLPMQRRLSALVGQVLAPQGAEERSEPGRTNDPAALTAFGSGLLAWDRGDVAAARAAFGRALELAPRFAEAEERVAFFDELLAAPPLDSLIVEVARVGELQRSVAALRAAPGSTHRDALARVGGRERALVSDMLGLDALTGGVLLDLTFTLPGGTP